MTWGDGWVLFIAIAAATVAFTSWMWPGKKRGARA